MSCLSEEPGRLRVAAHLLEQMDLSAYVRNAVIFRKVSCTLWLHRDGVTIG